MSLSFMICDNLCYFLHEMFTCVFHVFAIFYTLHTITFTSLFTVNKNYNPDIIKLVNCTIDINQLAALCQYQCVT